MSALLDCFAASLEAEEDQSRSTQSELAFNVRPSLWCHLSSLLQPAEVEEARRLIGHALIAENAAIEEEIRSLLYIASALHQPSPFPSPSSSPLPSPTIPSTSPSPSPLVPPLPSLLALNQREGLKEEIGFLISALRVKAANGASSGEVAGLVSGGLSEREVAIAKLVEREHQQRRFTSRSDSGTSSTSSRATTHRSRDSRPSTSTSQSSLSTSRAGTSQSSRSPSSSAASTSRLLGLHSSLSIYTLDGVVGRIRQALEEERSELLSDAAWLSSYVEDRTVLGPRADEDTEGASSHIPPPSESGAARAE